MNVVARRAIARLVARRAIARLVARSAVALLGLSAAAAPASAQDGFRRLSDGDVGRVIPLLRAQVEEGRWQAAKVQGLKRTSDETEQFMKRVASGAIDDPLAWLRGRLPAGVPVPPGVRYHRGCSVAMSKELYAPVAIFTFGVAATEFNLAMVEGRGDAGMAMKIDESGMNDLIRAAEGMLGGKGGFNLDSMNAAVASVSRDRSTPADRQAQKFVDETRAFYRARRFVTGSTVSVLEVTSADGRMFGWMNPAIATSRSPDCASMPTGPYLGVRYLEPDAPADEERGPLAAALERAGMSDDEFRDVHAALLMASVDVSDPHHATPLVLPGESAEQRRRAVAQAATRKNNVEVYSRHVAALGPLIAELKAMR